MLEHTENHFAQPAGWHAHCPQLTSGVFLVGFASCRNVNVSVGLPIRPLSSFESGSDRCGLLSFTLQYLLSL